MTIGQPRTGVFDHCSELHSLQVTCMQSLWNPSVRTSPCRIHRLASWSGRAIFELHHTIPKLLYACYDVVHSFLKTLRRHWTQLKLFERYRTRIRECVLCGGGGDICATKQHIWPSPPAESLIGELWNSCCIVKWSWKQLFPSAIRPICNSIGVDIDADP